MHECDAPSKFSTPDWTHIKCPMTIDLRSIDKEMRTAMKHAKWEDNVAYMERGVSEGWIDKDVKWSKEKKYQMTICCLRGIYLFRMLYNAFPKLKDDETVIKVIEQFIPETLFKRYYDEENKEYFYGIDKSLYKCIVEFMENIDCKEMVFGGYEANIKMKRRTHDFCKTKMIVLDQKMYKF